MECVGVVIVACTWELGCLGRSPEHLVIWECKLGSMKSAEGLASLNFGISWVTWSTVKLSEACPSSWRCTSVPSVGRLLMDLLYSAATLKKLISWACGLSRNCILVLLWQRSSSLKQKWRRHGGFKTCLEILCLGSHQGPLNRGGSLFLASNENATGDTSWLLWLYHKRWRDFYQALSLDHTLLEGVRSQTPLMQSQVRDSVEDHKEIEWCLLSCSRFQLFAPSQPKHQTWEWGSPWDNSRWFAGTWETLSQNHLAKLSQFPKTWEMTIIAECWFKTQSLGSVLHGSR